MRRWVGVVGSVVLAAACARAPLVSRASVPTRPREPLAAGLGAVSEDPDRASRLLAEAAEVYPQLDDYALFFAARAERRAGRAREALDKAAAVSARHPDSVWLGRAELLRGDLLRAAGDADGARGAFAGARAALPRATKPWVRATLSLAEIEYRLGNADAALDLAQELRHAAPRGLGARRARRLATRVWRVRPDLVVDHVDEAETRLREGDAAGSRAEAELALAGQPAPPLRARALWTRAHAERALGLTPAAESTCLALAAAVPDDALAPRALLTAATWHWNADDDAGALRLYHDLGRRFPDSAQAPEALYAIGRIAQEAGRWDEARGAYTRVAERYPRADVAAEARWRAAWVRWLPGEIAAAEQAFADVARHTKHATRVAAEYWRARALARLGRDADARERLEHVAEHHRTSYYAGLAEERIGRRPPDAEPPMAVAAPAFPADLAGAHAERARLLDRLGLRRFARTELDAISSAEAPRRLVLDAYRAIGAVGSALRLANALRGPRPTPAPPREEFYPLGYWDVVRPAARARGVDPFLVTALIRQESLFEPDAVSPAGAHGLMQLLPSTARRIRHADGKPAPSVAALHDVATNVDIGTALLARLLAQYGGSAPKALAAYNGGEDAVAKWDQRYAGREPDEWVELISFRETRDYVKAVMRNHRLYRLVYAAPSASVTSAGSPPNAPFDMITTTSPGRVLPTR